MAEVGNARIFVSPALTGRLGNNVLQVYRAFWFSVVHGMGFGSVVINDNRGVSSHAMFSRVKPYIKSKEEYEKIKFNRLDNRHKSSTLSVKEQLLDVSVPECGNLLLPGLPFIYPELPWERALFVELFDNKKKRKELASKYRNVLCGNTVGYTVRRTDTVNRGGCLTLKPDKILSDLRRVIDLYGHSVTIVATSDDTSFVREVVSSDAVVAGHTRVIDDDPDNSIYLLSMCDYVFSNSRVQCTAAWESHPKLYFSSTFGQVAQILNRSYKYADVFSGLDLHNLASNHAMVRDRGNFICDCGYEYVDKVQYIE